MAEEDSAEKSHEPTPKKLEDARKKGEVVKSAELNTAAAYLGLLLGFAFLGGEPLQELGAKISQFFVQADDFARLAFGGGGATPLPALLQSILLDLAVVFALPAGAVIACLFAQRAWTFSGQKLAPKLNRISPLTGAKNKFGPNGLFEFTKSSAKLIVVSLILLWWAWQRRDEVIGSAQADVGQAIWMMGRYISEFLLLVLVLTVAVGVADYAWQYRSHMAKNRMTRKEVEDEIKASEGDPHHKQTRRQRALDIAMNQMLADVPSADVVLVNPTHFAVALKWDRGGAQAPICVAKGADEIAARIREAAQAAGVPIHSDPPTTRAIFGTVEIGEPIKRDHYKSVAVAIRFAEDMRRKARKGRR